MPVLQIRIRGPTQKVSPAGNTETTYFFLIELKGGLY